MKSSNGILPRRRRRTPPARRAELLAAFERSGLSAADFVRQHGLGYTTFCGWRHRQAKTKPAPAFVEVDLSAAATPGELVIEVGAHVRLRLSSASQIELAVGLLHRLNTLASC